MRAAVSVAVTVKCRIGVDDQDPEAALSAIADSVFAAGADALIVHARKAWLKGLSPKENRDVPPLDHALVYRLKDSHPALPIAINGGAETLGDAKAHLRRVDGVMVGRAAYQRPELLLDVDHELFGEARPLPDAFAALEALEPYILAELARGTRLSQLTRHLLGLFQGRPGARAFRRHLATEATRPGAGLEVLRDAVAHVARAEAGPERVAA